MILLLDIGNSRIKWCTEKKGCFEPVTAISHKKIDFVSDLQHSWSKLQTPQILAISSVSSDFIVQQLITLATKLWPDILIIKAKSSAQFRQLTNAYQYVEKLGVDRWLGLIALRHYYPGKSCFIDCGTAITIDFLDAYGQHLGGLISPGLELMKRSLAVETESLGFKTQHYPVGLTDNTEAAIYSGVLYAATGLIEKIITDFKEGGTVVLTGGDAELIAKNLQFKMTIEPDFVLKGLSLYCNEVLS